MKKDNPFFLNVYAGPEYFCNREKETDIVINAISNKRNLTLILLENTTLEPQVPLKLRLQLY